MTTREARTLKVGDRIIYHMKLKHGRHTCLFPGTVSKLLDTEYMVIWDDGTRPAWIYFRDSKDIEREVKQ